MSGAPQAKRVGTRFGQYHLKRLLGAGGFGEVYEAEDTVRDRIVALKLLPEELSKDPVFRKRMQREALAAGRLQEPHVVPIHDYGEIDGLLYVDMRLIDGTDLHAVLVKDGPLPPPRAVAIIRQVAAALDAAHKAGVMHRDVKPENVLITEDDFAYLVDFGLATAATDERLTQMGTMIGTFTYMAPERFRDKAVTPRSDVYSLACVLHECLTGSRPYRADSLGALITCHLTAPIPRPSQMRPGIPTAMDLVIARGMAKNPEDRYVSAGDMALAAQGALGRTDKRRAATIFERSNEATEPKGGGVIRQPPTVPFRPAPPPRTAAPTSSPAMGSEPQRFAGPRYMTPKAAFSSGPDRAAPPPYSSGPQRAVTPSPPSTGPRQSAPQSKRGSHKLLIVVATAAVVALVVSVVLLLTNPWKDDSAPTPPTTTSPTTSPADSLQKLYNQLPQGFSSSNCQKSDNPSKGPSAGVYCAKSLPTALTEAGFWLYPDQSSLDARFEELIKGFPASPCPGSQASPDTWHNDKTPNQIEGKIVCGTYQGKPELLWTENQDLFLGDIVGSDINSLYQWWTTHAQ